MSWGRAEAGSAPGVRTGLRHAVQQQPVTMRGLAYRPARTMVGPALRPLMRRTLQPVHRAGPTRPGIEPRLRTKPRPHLARCAWKLSVQMATDDANVHDCPW